MKKSRFVLAPLAAFALLATACSDSSDETGSSTADTEAPSTDSVEVTEGEDVTIAVITHGDGGVFWSVPWIGR